MRHAQTHSRHRQEHLPCADPTKNLIELLDGSDMLMLSTKSLQAAQGQLRKELRRCQALVERAGKMDFEEQGVVYDQIPQIEFALASIEAVLAGRKAPGPSVN